jgi:hypothetical protein
MSWDWAPVKLLAGEPATHRRTLSRGPAQAAVSQTAPEHVMSWDAQ